MPSRRVRQHVNPLRSDYLRINPAAIVAPPEVPIEVELGAAEALFLMDRAQAEPHGLYIGLELRAEMVARSNRAAVRAGLPQVRNVFANISVDLPRLFPQGGVKRFFLNFPDPWWKAKQHKRRVAGQDLVADIHQALRPGGEIFVNTDIFAIALESLALFEGEGSQRFVNLAGEWRFLRASRFAARSRRERQCEAEGSKIWRLGFGRV